MYQSYADQESEWKLSYLNQEQSESRLRAVWTLLPSVDAGWAQGCVDTAPFRRWWVSLGLAPIPQETPTLLGQAAAPALWKDSWTHQARPGWTGPPLPLCTCWPRAALPCFGSSSHWYKQLNFLQGRAVHQIKGVCGKITKQDIIRW